MSERQFQLMKQKAERAARRTQEQLDELEDQKARLETLQSTSKVSIPVDRIKGRKAWGKLKSNSGTRQGARRAARRDFLSKKEEADSEVERLRNELEASRAEVAALRDLPAGLRAAAHNLPRLAGEPAVDSAESLRLKMTQIRDRSKRKSHAREFDSASSTSGEDYGAEEEEGQLRNLHSEEREAAWVERHRKLEELLQMERSQHFHTREDIRNPAPYEIDPGGAVRFKYAAFHGLPKHRRQALLQIDAELTGYVALSDLLHTPESRIVQAAAKQLSTHSLSITALMCCLAICAFFGLAFAAAQMMATTDAEDGCFIVKDSNAVIRTLRSEQSFPLALSPLVPINMVTTLQFRILSYTDDKVDNAMIISCDRSTQYLKEEDPPPEGCAESIVMHVRSIVHHGIDESVAIFHTASRLMLDENDGNRSLSVTVDKGTITVDNLQYARGHGSAAPEAEKTTNATNATNGTGSGSADSLADSSPSSAGSGSGSSTGSSGQSTNGGELDEASLLRGIGCGDVLFRRAFIQGIQEEVAKRLASRLDFGYGGDGRCGA